MDNNPKNKQERTFKCADAGYKQCNWEVSGSDDNEIMDRVREHGREAHGITNFDDKMKQTVKDHIRDRQAA